MAATRTGPKPVFINNVVTPVGRICYPHLDKPSSSAEGTEPKFGVELLIDKKADISALKKAVLDCAVQAFGPEVIEVKNGQKTKRPRKLSDIVMPFKDGDEKANELTAQDKDPGAYPGTIYLRARSKRRPQVVNRDKADMDPTEVYGGCYGRLVLSAMSYLTVQGNKPAVTFLLDIVQFVREGEALGGSGKKASRDDLPDDLPAEEGAVAGDGPSDAGAPAGGMFD